MSWPKYVLIAIYVFSALASIAMIGKERKPTDPTTAIIGVCLCVAFCWLVVIA